MYQSETAKYRHLTIQYCQGRGIDIGSQGDPVVPHAWNFDLPYHEFVKYNGGNPPRSPIQLWGYGHHMPFIGSGSLDFVYSSHLLEDFLEWRPILKEWVRVLRPGGHLVILIPDRELWRKAVAGGQPPNPAHKHEGWAGELSTYAAGLGLQVLEDRLTNIAPGDYSILFVAKKIVV